MSAGCRALQSSNFSNSPNRSFRTPHCLIEDRLKRLRCWIAITQFAKSMSFINVFSIILPNRPRDREISFSYLPKCIKSCQRAVESNKVAFNTMENIIADVRGSSWKHTQWRSRVRSVESCWCIWRLTDASRRNERRTKFISLTLASTFHPRTFAVRASDALSRCNVSGIARSSASASIFALFAPFDDATRVQRNSSLSPPYRPHPRLPCTQPSIPPMRRHMHSHRRRDGRRSRTYRVDLQA